MCRPIGFAFRFRLIGPWAVRGGFPPPEQRLTEPMSTKRAVGWAPPRGRFDSNRKCGSWAVKWMHQIWSEPSESTCPGRPVSASKRRRFLDVGMVRKGIQYLWWRVGVDVLSTVTSVTKPLGLHPINLPYRETIRLLMHTASWYSSVPPAPLRYMSTSTIGFGRSKEEVLTLRTSFI